MIVRFRSSCAFSKACRIALLMEPVVVAETSQGEVNRQHTLMRRTFGGLFL